MGRETVLLVIDVGGTNTVCETYDVQGSELLSETRGTADVFADGAAGFVQHVKEFVHKHKARYPHTDLGVGVVGVPGIVSLDGTRVISCPNLKELDGLPLGKELSAAIEVPVYVYKDTELAAVGEQQLGAARGFANAVCVMLGTGIGCGLVFNGRVWRGDHSLAGEIGHTIIIPDGRPCTCGRRGCLEMYCSGKAFGRLAVELGLAPSDEHRKSESSLARLLFEAAESGNEAAEKAITEGFALLGTALANMVNLVNPGIIVLGGGLMAGGAAYRGVVEKAYMDSVRSFAAAVPSIVESQLGAKAVTKGAWVEGKRILEGRD
ncbi:MAG TPA: ROK family protein [Firmicutes bacterium]|nr:ROK family protein [Bacillota bacterium]